MPELDVVAVLVGTVLLLVLGGVYYAILADQLVGGLAWAGDLPGRHPTHIVGSWSIAYG